MKEHEILKTGTLIRLEGEKAMVNLVKKACASDAKCLCFLDKLTTEELVQNLLLEHANVNLNEFITPEKYQKLAKSMQDVCTWDLYVGKFETLTKTNNRIKKLNPDYVFIESEQNDIIEKRLKTMAQQYQVVIILF